VLENIHRHLELGELPIAAAEKGGKEVALPVLAATLTTIVVFFPVTLLTGVSKFLFSALALAVVLSLAASYLVAMTVVPLFCSRFISTAGHDTAAVHDKPDRQSLGHRFNNAFARLFGRLLDGYSVIVARTLARPIASLAFFAVIVGAAPCFFPLLGVSFIPRTDAGQFVISVKAPSGTRLEETEKDIAKLEGLIRSTISQGDLGMIVSNVGVDPGFSAIYSTNTAMHTASVQVSLKEGHRVGSFEYIDRVKERARRELPQLATFFSTGSLVDAVLNMGMRAPIDIQISGSNLKASYQFALDLSSEIRSFPQTGDVFIPQDLDYPALKLDVDRMRAGELGLTQKEVVGNVITALTSNAMVAPTVLIDPRNGNNYLLSVQYAENQIRSVSDLEFMPTRLDMVSHITHMLSPTEVDHYQIRRNIDVFVRGREEDLEIISNRIESAIAHLKVPAGTSVKLRGMVESMRTSLKSFGLGLILSTVLLYLILVAQFRSYTDPLIILLAFPPGLAGVVLTLLWTGTTINVMSLMGIVMLAGITMSDGILIVEFARHRVREGRSVKEVVVEACRVRLRPIMMTTLATIIGLLPMALKLGEGSESYAPLARSLVGGLKVSGICTIFVVPTAFYLWNREPMEGLVPSEARLRLKIPYFPA
jgi:multidrug efflux pump subunit AcrB